MDHDDFTKTRKALLATSAFLLLVNHLQISGDSLTVVGLMFKLDKSVILGFGSLFLIYFIYAFAFRAFELYMTRKITEVRQGLKEVREDIEKADETSSALRWELLQRAKHTLSVVEGATVKLQSSVMIGLEVGPPLVLAIYTGCSIGAISAARSFLSL